MRRQTIGRELTVGRLCLGTMFFGTRIDGDTSFAILDRFAEAGGNFLDTANCYPFWVDGASGAESELLVGRWLARRGVRDGFVVATKVGARPARWGASWPEHAEGLSAPVVAAQAEASLRRLGTDRIDLYYAHIDDPAVPQEETLSAFGALVAAGTVRTLGCSNFSVERLRQARELSRELGLPPFECVQLRHTYLRPATGALFGVQRHATDELLALVRAEPDLTLLGYSPLLSGAYVRDERPVPPQYLHSGTARRLAVLYEVAAKIGATPNQVVLAWMLASDPAAVPVIGVSTVAQLDECLGALDLNVDGVLARLDRAGRAAAATSGPYPGEG